VSYNRDTTRRRKADFLYTIEKPMPEHAAGHGSDAIAAKASPSPDPDLSASAPRLRAGFGVWVRDLIISLAISAFIIIFIYQPVKV